tara:strand:+ start:119 stop:349 length:231 start_codon:yes stop_codon:yes gene_type:complete
MRLIGIWGMSLGLVLLISYSGYSAIRYAILDPEVSIVVKIAIPMIWIGGVLGTIAVLKDRIRSKKATDDRIERAEP